MLASVIGIVNPGTAASAILGILVCYCFCHVFEKRPFKDDDDNDLGIVLAWSLTLFFLSAICIKADLTQDSGDEQEIFGAALVVILATGPALIVLQTLSAVVQCLFCRMNRSKNSLDDSDDDEKVSTLKSRRRQAPIGLYKQMNRMRGSMSADVDLEEGPGIGRQLPRLLVEDRNRGMELEDLPRNVSKIRESKLGNSRREELRLEDMRGVMSRDRRTSRRSKDRISFSGDSKKDLEACRSSFTDFDLDGSISGGYNGISLDSGYVSCTRRKSFTAEDLEAILIPDVEKLSLRQRVAVRKATFSVNETDTEQMGGNFRTRLALRQMLLPKRNMKHSTKMPPRPRWQAKAEEEDGEDWGPMPSSRSRSREIECSISFEEYEPEVHYEESLYEESRIKAKYHQMLELHRVDELDRALFKELIKILLKEDKSVKSLPSDQDLDWVFEVADADQSGLLDEDEFVALYKLASAGHVKGVGKKNASKKENFKKSFDAAGLPARLPIPRRASAFARSVDDVTHKKGTVQDFLASIKMGAFWPEFEKRGHTMFCDFMDSRDFSDDVLQEMGMSKVTIQFFRRLLVHGAVQIYLKANGASDGSVFSDIEVRAIYQEMLKSCAIEELDISQFKDFIKSLLKTSARGTMPSDQDLEQAFKVADANNSNAIDEDEALAVYKMACAGKVNGLSKANLFSSKKVDFKKSLKTSGFSKQLKKNPRQKSFRASKEAPSYESGSVPVSTLKCHDLTNSTLLFC